MEDDSTIDPSTGLLHRAAFLQEVRNGQAKIPAHVRRGCLLILHFPMLQSIAEQGGTDAATRALKNLLAVVETRLRSRDTLGRIAQHSLCILLRQCKEKDAVIIAEQYVALLRDVIIDTGKQVGPVQLRYRIVPLDSLGHRPRQGVSRLIHEPVPGDAIDLAQSTAYVKRIEEETPDKVVSITRARVKQKQANKTETEAVDRQGEPSIKGDLPVYRDRHLAKIRTSLRIKPGLLINNKPLVCCYRVQQVGAEPDLSMLQSNSMVHYALDALSLDRSANRPAIESQLILPIQASQLDSDAPTWLKRECTTRRVAPSDVCVSISLDSLAADLRSTVPVLRLLNRLGIRLMLEGASSPGQFRALHNLASFDYLYISARTLQSSWRQVRQRQEVHELIAQARKQGCEICAAGIDSNVLLQHARELGIDIGFGRECGRSLPFPTETA